MMRVAFHFSLHVGGVFVIIQSPRNKFINTNTETQYILFNSDYCPFYFPVYVFLLMSTYVYSYCSSMYSYCCLCILIVVYVFLLFVHVFLSLSMYTYYCPCILRRGYPD